LSHQPQTHSTHIGSVATPWSCHGCSILCLHPLLKVLSILIALLTSSQISEIDSHKAICYESQNSKKRTISQNLKDYGKSLTIIDLWSCAHVQQRLTINKISWFVSSRGLMNDSLLPALKCSWWTFYLFANHVFSMVLHQERQSLVSIPAFMEHNLLANNSMIYSPFVGRGGGGPSISICTYCHRSGHTVEEYHQKHGYLVGHPRYPSRPRFNSRHSTHTVNSVVIDGKTNEAIEQVIRPNLPFSQA